MDEGGEYGELTIELAASLAPHNTPVTAAERDELLALLEAASSGIGHAESYGCGTRPDRGIAAKSLSVRRVQHADW